jgi:hypothetical protein
MSVYGTACDAILMVFVMDEEIEVLLIINYFKVIIGK